MAHIDRIKVGNDTHLIEPILYITPSLSESAYSVTLNNFELVTGVAIQAKFTVTNPANATLNVSSSGNKAIHYNGAAITGGLIKVNHIYTLIYDGSVWCITGDISEAAEPQLRTYRSNTNVQLPLVGLNAVANIISDYNITTSITSGSYGNMYGAIPENTAKLATINPSTGAITVPGGIIGNLIGTVNGYTIDANVPSGAVFTDTHRPISIDGTQILGNNITTLDLIAGSHISLTNNGGAITIANIMTAADLGLSSAMHFIGISSTEITDEGVEVPTINNLDNYTPVNGDVVLYGDNEFVWSNSIWRALGSSSSFLTGYISYGKIIVGNDSSTTGYVQAINGNESLTIRGSNNWIILTATNSSTTNEDEIEIAHSLSGVTAGSYGNSSDQEPEAGDTFNVPYITVDTAGHITAAANYTVKIPLLSTTVKLIVNSSSSSTSQTNSALTNENVYLNLIQDNTVIRSSHNIYGTGAAEVTTSADGSEIIVYSQDTILKWDSTNSKIVSIIDNSVVSGGLTIEAGSNITLDASGQSISISGTANDKVKQSGVTTDSNFPILFKNSTSTDDETNEIKFGKATNKNITVNPSTGTITASIFSGALSGNADTATSWAVTQTVYVDLESSGTNSTLNGGQSTAQVLKVDGTLPIGNGGTGTSTAPNQYGVIYAATTSTYASTAAGDTGNVFIAQTNGAPIWYTGLSLESTTSNNETTYNATFLGDVSISGALSVTGATTLGSTLNVANNLSVGGTLGVTGQTTLNSSLSVGTTLSVTGATTLNSTLSVNDTSTLTGNVGIGGSPDSNYKLYVNGNSKFNGNSTFTGNIVPSTTNIYYLGDNTQNSEKRWAGLYVGTADTYGDAYTPVYWNNGVPCAVPPVQYIEWTIAEGTTGITLHNPAFSSSTYVLQLVITSGEENLKDNLTWSTSSGELTLSANEQVTDDVTGYAIVARGEQLTNTTNN